MWSALALLAATGCNPPEKPRWIDLVDAIGSATQRIDAPEHTLPDGKRAHLLSDAGGVRLEIALSAADWASWEQPHFRLAQFALLLTGGGRTNSSGFRLTSGKREFQPAPSWNLEQGFPPQCFLVGREGVLVRLNKGEPPPDQATLSVSLQGGEDDAGRVWGHRYSGRGFQLWPGQVLSLRTEVPPGSKLRFATTLEPMIERTQGASPVVFRILQDGEPVFQHVLADPSLASSNWHGVDLRPAARSELSFEVRGALAVTAFLAPVIGPADVGVPGHRPWDETRPDLLIFLADTFRADNLGVYGGTLGLTPNLDRLAGESLLFRRAWSVGTYALPSHVSLFTGVMPYKAGIHTIQNAMPESMKTIAELLTAAGYRTAAVTDSGMVSRRRGFDQGFAYFDEKHEGLEETGARALACVDADDGRPLFLFVHSYRAHTPYHVSEETRNFQGEKLGIPGDFNELERELHELARKHEVPYVAGKYPPAFLGSETVAPVLDAMKTLYLGGVADVDRGFGHFWAALEERRWRDHGALVFTSDHGEAFGEHGEIQHGDKVFEAKVRIPLFLTGAGIPRRVSDQAASLVDLAPTLAALAGLPVRPEWVGQSLLSLAHDRPVFSFGFDNDSTFSVVEGARKVIGFQSEGRIERERLLGGFDLEADPGEEVDVRRDGQTWPTEMLRRFGPAIESALALGVEARSAVLDEADMDELDKLGYGSR